MSINYHRKTFLRFTTENHFICKIAISKILVKGNKKPANGVTSDRCKIKHKKSPNLKKIQVGNEIGKMGMLLGNLLLFFFK